jgi:hypothetical protein
MGLDATVYCDCYEKGRLREPPPGGEGLRVYTDGSLGREHDDGELESDLAFDQWYYFRACEHSDGVLVGHHLGNIALIDLLRGELQREVERFPILCSRVIYSGTHAGDYLQVELIPDLQQELELLREFQCSSREADQYMKDFREKMFELASAALSIGKPIAF